MPSLLSKARCIIIDVALLKLALSCEALLLPRKRFRREMPTWAPSHLHRWAPQKAQASLATPAQDAGAGAGTGKACTRHKTQHFVRLQAARRDFPELFPWLRNIIIPERLGGCKVLIWFAPGLCTFYCSWPSHYQLHSGFALSIVPGLCIVHCTGALFYPLCQRFALSFELYSNLTHLHRAVRDSFIMGKPMKSSSDLMKYGWMDEWMGGAYRGLVGFQLMQVWLGAS
eukprot:357758-Chlamydomonas_euryale.AAC.3